MEFKTLKEKLQKNFAILTKNATHLFEVEVDKDEFWEHYQNSFPEGQNPIFRERRVHDCSSCRQFVKNIGMAVVIENNQVKTIWDFEANSSEEYSPVMKAMDDFIKSKPVTNVYITKDKTIGINNNKELLDNGQVVTWEHFFLKLPDRFIYKGAKSIGDVKGSLRDVRNVFKRSLDEITLESLLTVLELISQKSLYKGEEWQSVLTEVVKHKKAYNKLETTTLKDNYTWEQSVKVGGVIGKIRNHSIGTLLVNISEGMDLDTAVKKYEAIVAPSNYKRPKAIFTKKMLEDAKKTVNELGYGDSLARRFATLDDITVNNILFSNKDSANRIAGFDVFDEMAKTVPMSPKKFSKVEEISIEAFVNNVLPIAKELEVFLENKHSSNMVSLIAPEVKDSKTMFKWDNNFGWAYSGNITDSDMKERVKSAGGKVDGDLRFSIQWNEDGRDITDLDAHCKEPSGGSHIYYKDKISKKTKGRLDVDITSPRGTAVENITWANRNTMIDGTYKFYVHDYSGRGTKDGFRAEIEFDGNVYSFDSPAFGRTKRDIAVAEVTLKNGVFTIKENLTSEMSSKDIWNVTTNQFVSASIVMYSPNYWDEQDGIGHRHYFFMLKDCVNSELPNGFYNEFLKEDLMKHKRVFEALGGKMAVKDVEDQLSGIGFSATKRNDLIVKVTGQSERVLKIKF